MCTSWRPVLPLRTRKPCGVTTNGRSRSPTPSSVNIRVALGESWIPAPVSSRRSACSSKVTWKPLRANASAEVRPAMPAPATITLRVDVRTHAPASRLRGVGQGTFLRTGRARRQSRVVAVKRRAVGADVFLVVAHVTVHMRVVERRLGADAHEFAGADLDHGDAQVI